MQTRLSLESLEDRCVPSSLSGWRATDVAIGADNQARVLWGGAATGQADIWTVNSTMFGSAAPAQTLGATPVGDAIGHDGITRILATKTDGSTVLSLSNPDGSLLKQTTFGPIAGWTAQDVAVSSNGTLILWANPNGSAALWTVDSNFNVTAASVYGPLSGWSPSKLDVASDGSMRLLWVNSNGSSALWILNADGSFNSATTFGAMAGWTPIDVTVASTGQTCLLWSSSSGAAALWELNSSLALQSSVVYGPFAGWMPVALSADAADNLALLWANPNAMVNGSLWLLDGSGNFQAAAIFAF